MNLRLVTPASQYPVTLSEVKNHLRLPQSYTSEDERLFFFIKAATKEAEDKTNRQLLTATWRATLDEWVNPVVVNKCPVIAVTSVKYYDTAGVQQTLSASQYIVDTESEPWRITPAYGCTLPPVRCQINAIQVNFTAGYASASLVPANIKAGIMLIIGDLWKNRENIVIGRMVSQIPWGAEQLFLNERITWIS